MTGVLFAILKESEGNKSEDLEKAGIESAKENAPIAKIEAKPCSWKYGD